jgi:hypothetical protein
MPVVLDFAAEAVHMNVHDIRVWLNSYSPDIFKNHGPCDNAARVPAEILQQNEFLRRKIEHSSTTRRFPPQEIQLEIEHSKTSRGSAGRAVSFDEIAQPRKQLRKCEGLREIVVATLLQAAHPIIDGTPRGKNQHWSRQSKPAEPKNQADSIVVRKAQVNHQNVMVSFDREPFRRLRIAGAIDLIAGFAQRSSEKALNFRVILNQQQAHTWMLMQAR